MRRVCLAYFSPGARLSKRMLSELPPRVSACRVSHIQLSPSERLKNELTLENPGQLAFAIRDDRCARVERVNHGAELRQRLVDGFGLRRCEMRSLAGGASSSTYLPRPDLVGPDLLVVLGPSKVDKRNTTLEDCPRGRRISRRSWPGQGEPPTHPFPSPAPWSGRRL